MTIHKNSGPPVGSPAAFFNPYNLVLHAFGGILIAIIIFPLEERHINFSKTVREIDAEHLRVSQPLVVLYKIIAVAVLAADPGAEDIADVE